MSDRETLCIDLLALFDAANAIANAAPAAFVGQTLIGSSTPPVADSCSLTILTSMLVLR